MKYIKLIIIATFLSTMFTGCSYVSDSVEGRITDRASFSATASYSGGNVIINWDKTDTGANFTGIEIYRSSDANDEYATYELVASRLYHDSGLNLNSGFTQTYSDTFLTTYTNLTPATGGVYFYRVAFIYWDNDADERIPGSNGYTGVDTTDYNNKTNIDAISGYAKVVIP